MNEQTFEMYSEMPKHTKFRFSGDKKVKEQIRSLQIPVVLDSEEKVIQHFGGVQPGCD